MSTDAEAEQSSTLVTSGFTCDFRAQEASSPPSHGTLTTPTRPHRSTV